jgi:hypothetical protein
MFLSSTYQLALIPDTPMIGSRSHDGHHVPGHLRDPHFCTKNSCWNDTRKNVNMDAEKRKRETTTQQQWQQQGGTLLTTMMMR